MTKSSNPPIRRIVTGHSPTNIAKVLIDAPALNWKGSSPGTISTLIWSTDSAPATMPVGETIEDFGARTMGTAPPHQGTRFAIIDFPPGNEAIMHRTETIDYVIVMEGEIEMDLDEGSVRLKAGDVMIQRGTNHAWKNRSEQRARLAFILIDAVPLGFGRPVVGSENVR